MGGCERERDGKKKGEEKAVLPACGCFDGGWARVAVPGGQAASERKGYGLTLVYRKLSLCNNTDVCLHDLKRDESHTNKPETLVHMHCVIWGMRGCWGGACQCLPIAHICAWFGGIHACINLKGHI